MEKTFDTTGYMSGDELKAWSHAYVDAQAEILVLRARARLNITA